MPDINPSLRRGEDRPRIAVLAALLALLLCTAVPTPVLASPAQPAADAWARLGAWIGALWDGAPGTPGGVDHRLGAAFGGTGGGDQGLGLDPDGTDPDPTPDGTQDPDPTPTPTTSGLTLRGPALAPATPVRGRI
jgi:hypothetical protein